MKPAASPLELHGSFALAMSTRQPSLSLFSGSCGEIAYHPALHALGSSLVLGDPLCSEANRPAMLAEYLAANPRSAFLQVSESTAIELGRIGFHCTPMGFESWIPLQDWHLRGQARKYLRYVLSRARRQAVTLQDWPDYLERMDELQEISRHWLGLRRRNASELHFLARPLDSCHDPATRCFVARRDGRTIAFVMFDPLYRDGRVIGYAASLLRSRELGSAGWQDFIVLGAMEHFRLRGLEWLTLGLSPFAPAEAAQAISSPPATRAIFSWWLEHGNWLYNFRGVGFHKRRYPAQRRTMYFCSRQALPLLELRDALAAMRVRPLQRLGGHLLGMLESASG
ncbi:DUF2156 domain-containing protein [bacterium]|nr:DUF2156 domain-containing protein [bacterium]UNM08642.1 MAG: DUF2156 domain-containing protein [Planctomycetales bacterium]